MGDIVIAGNILSGEMTIRFKNQSYSKLKKKCQTEGKLFVDPEFPPEVKSMYYSRPMAPESIEWKRPKDICEDPHLFVSGIDTKDVTQGKLGNCWFVAACALVAQEAVFWRKVIPDSEKQEWDPAKPNEYQGIFRFRFWRFGQWCEVVVDDLLPTHNGELVYVRSTAKNEFWSALVEKAYAKINGCYEVLEGGNTADALADFTGGVAEPIDIVDGGYSTDSDKRMQLYKELSDAMKHNHALISASIRTKDAAEVEKRTENGLVLGHAYGVTAIKKITLGEGFLSLFNRHYLYLIRLRNPWGQKEWKGAWSDGSPEWNKLKASDREKLGIVFEEDGEFWMSFEDFCTYFTTANVCHVPNTKVLSVRKRWRAAVHKGKWQSGVNAGGCVNNKDSFFKNPQYAFTVSDDKHRHCLVALQQKDSRPEKAQGKEALTIGFFIMRVEVNRQYRLHSSMEKAGSSIFINAREVFCKLELDAGRYIIVPSTFDPNNDGEYMLRIYTEKSGKSRELTKDNDKASPFLCCIPKYGTPNCVLSVTVISGSGLKKMSRFGVGADPYCIISCDGRKVKTPVQNDTLNPKFNAGGLFYARNVNSAIVIDVFDSNIFYDSFMGRATIPVAVNDKTVQQSVQLKGRGRRVSEEMPGTLTVKIACYAELQSI